MAKMVFINLPVSNMQQSVDFYKALGFQQNMDFSSDQGVAMVWSEEIWVMLLTHEFFKKFTAGRMIPDTHQYAQVLNALSFDSQPELEQFVEAARKAGATILPQVIVEGAENMVSIDIADPDGHIWETIYME